MPDLVKDVWRHANSRTKASYLRFFETPRLYENGATLPRVVETYKQFVEQAKRDQITLDYSTRTLLEGMRAAWLREMVLQLRSSTVDVEEGHAPGYLTQLGNKVVKPVSRIVCLIAFIGGVIKELSEISDSYNSTILPILGGAVPSFILIAIAAVFAALALTVYVAFEFTTIREKMGRGSAKKTELDELAEQKKQLLLIQQSLPTYLILHKNDKDASDMAKMLIHALIAQHQKLQAEKRVYEDKLADPKLKIMKYLLNGILSVMYASNGFFICQTGIPLIIAALNYLIPALAITAPIPWLMLAIAILGATAAFIAFWCIEGEALGDFLSNSILFGFAKAETVENLYNHEMAASKIELDTLLEQLDQETSTTNNNGNGSLLKPRCLDSTSSSGETSIDGFETSGRDNTDVFPSLVALC